MQSVEVLRIFEKLGVFEDGHYEYASGRHGRKYVNKDVIYPHTAVVSRLCAEIARRFIAAPISVVAAPEKGGIILSQWTAHHLRLMTGRDVLAVFAEKTAGGFAFKRRYNRLVTGSDVLIVEDNLTTGGSARQVVDLVRTTGGRVVGLGALLNRGGVTAEMLGNPPLFAALADYPLESWEPEDCPLCEQEVPINSDLGKRVA